MDSTSSSDGTKRPNGSEGSRGTFVKRAASIKSNTAGWQLVADMADHLCSVDDKLDLIITLLKDRMA